jgi:hypothetical protein
VRAALHSPPRSLARLATTPRGSASIAGLSNQIFRFVREVDSAPAASVAAIAAIQRVFGVQIWFG